jgi:hypothetical protein
MVYSWIKIPDMVLEKKLVDYIQCNTQGSGNATEQLMGGGSLSYDKTGGRGTPFLFVWSGGSVTLCGYMIFLPFHCGRYLVQTKG